MQSGVYVHIWNRIENGETDFDDEIAGYKIRVVGIKLSTGEMEVLITSLKNRDKITLDHLNRLYSLRWKIEESYKKIKFIMQLGNFSGTKLEAVLQDFWAHMTMCNILTVFILDKEPPWNPDDMPEYKLNFSVLLGTTREKLRDCLLGKTSEEDFCTLFDRVAKRAKVKVRLGRMFERKNIGKPRRIHVFRRVC